MKMLEVTLLLIASIAFAAGCNVRATATHFSAEKDHWGVVVEAPDGRLDSVFVRVPEDVSVEGRFVVLHGPSADGNASVRVYRVD
jgi:hypothetical protein